MPAEEQDISMEESKSEEQQYKDPEKIIVLPGASEDGTAVSFQIKQEDHTLGNSLRYVIMKNPQVEFCGYSIPHPSEPKMNVRIQTYGEITAFQALQKGLQDLCDLCDVVEDKFREKVKEGDYALEEP